MEKFLGAGLPLTLAHQYQNTLLLQWGPIILNATLATLWMNRIKTILLDRQGSAPLRGHAFGAKRGLRITPIGGSGVCRCAPGHRPFIIKNGREYCRPAGPLVSGMQARIAGVTCSCLAGLKKAVGLHATIFSAVSCAGAAEGLQRVRQHENQAIG